VLFPQVVDVASGGFTDPKAEKSQHRDEREVAVVRRTPPRREQSLELQVSESECRRLRWHRGALENLGAYGPTRATAMYWTQQTALAYGVVALWSYLLLMVITLMAADSIRWSLFWVTIGVVFFVERLVTVWAVGWRGRLLAAPIFVELAYALFLQVCFVTSIVQMATGRKAGWNYVPRPVVQSALLVPYGILLPASILTTGWYQALCLWVGFNTLVFATLSLLQLFPPLRLGSRFPRSSPR